MNNYPLIIQDKEYTYKLTDLRFDPYPLFSRINESDFTVLFDPPSLPYYPDERYDIDDATGDLYTIDNSIPIIWINRYEKSININAATGATRIYIQGDHLLIEAGARVFWVAYN